MFSSRTRFLFTLVLVASAFPGLAAPRRRAVKPPSTSFVIVSGRVTDQDTGAPVVAAEVAGFGRTGLTGADGRYQLQLPDSRVAVEARRSGYETTTRDVSATSGMVLDFVLKSKPTIRLRETNGTNHVLDGDSGEWAYVLSFSGYARGKEANFCKPDGSPVKVRIEEVAKVTGPAVNTANGCCTMGPMTAITATLKSGETTQLFFQDSCFGYIMDFIGRDHGTAQFLYLHFSDIAEIVFP